VKNIICIETSTEVCSVCLAIDGSLKAEKTTKESKSHASVLSVFISELLENSSLQASQIDALAVSKGPGSYTGLRIGVSVAKGFAYGSQAALIGVSTLHSMANGLVLENKIPENLKNKDFLLAPMLDARRMEVYTALFNPNMHSVSEIAAVIIDKNSFSEILNKQKIVFFGNGSAKCKSEINHENAIFIDDFSMSANHIVSIAFDKLERNQTEDLAYFEPYYLKDFIAKKPKDILNQLINQKK
jgi:tRNA threonylcarbamoyladenosine biosynthesis protein TsaB